MIVGVVLKDVFEDVGTAWLDGQAHLLEIQNEVRIPDNSVVRSLFVADGDDPLIGVLGELEPELLGAVAGAALAVPVDSPDDIFGVRARAVPLEDEVQEVLFGNGVFDVQDG